MGPAKLVYTAFQLLPYGGVWRFKTYIGEGFA